MHKRWIYFSPFFGALGIVVMFAMPLINPVNHSDFSPLIGKEMPNVSVRDLTTGQDVSPNVKDSDIFVVNFFASWCVPCRAEQTVLEELSARDDVYMWGIVYKDTGENIDTFLKETGNPFDTVGMDVGGKASIDFGISGVPETFFIKNGIVFHHHTGPLVMDDVDMILKKAARI